MRPKVIHPRPVLLYKRVETGIDPDFGPTGEVEWSEPIELQGQVQWDKFQQLEPVSNGNDPISSGHIVFYDDEWVKAGGSVNDEMELVEDFTEPSRLIITEIRPVAHYHGKNWHVHVYFQRRRTVSK